MSQFGNFNVSLLFLFYWILFYFRKSISLFVLAERNLVVSFWLLVAGLNHERRGGIGPDAQQQRKAHNPEEKERIETCSTPWTPGMKRMLTGGAMHRTFVAIRHCQYATYVLPLLDILPTYLPILPPHLHPISSRVYVCVFACVLDRFNRSSARFGSVGGSNINDSFSGMARIRWWRSGVNWLESRSTTVITI